MKKQFKQATMPALLVVAMGLSGCSNILYSGSSAPVYASTQAKRSGSTAPIVLNSTMTPVSSSLSSSSTMTTTTASIEQPSNDMAVNTSRNNPYSTYGSDSAETGVQVIPAQPMRTTASTAATTAQTVANSTVNSAANTASTVTNGATSATSSATNAVTNGVTYAQQDISNTVNSGTQYVNNATAAADTRIKEATEVLAQAQTGAETAETAVSTAQTATQTAQNTATTAAKTATPSATTALLQEARAAVGSGDYDKAASALERAHRIEPGNAKILYDIAQIRYAQGKYSQAESFASKAASLSGSSSLSKKAWTLLSNSRKALGNASGAASAAQKAASF